jgi:pimeloyl-ACP methyl ester carboxylesterase
VSRHVEISDTRLHVVERGADGLPLLILHGGPALDHHMFGDYLDPLGDEFHLVLVDQRSQGRSDRAPTETWTLERMAADVGELAEAMGFDRYATLGHSYGAFVVLQQAVDRPGHAAATIVSSGAPSARFLAAVEDNLATFEPVELREQVTQSWAREQEARTAEECDALLHDQLPFHFADPRDPRIEEFERRTAGLVASPDLLRHFAVADYGAIEVEDRLGEITQPVLVLSGRHDRTCVVEAGEAIAAGIGDAELVVFENSGHMTYVEENEAYLAAVRRFLQSVP